MNDPDVSIVIPVYNQSVYLGRTIESVLRQDSPGIECIVVDDGSTDDSFDVASAYRNKVVVLRQENRGQAAALNRGFAASNGRYIGYLNSDDTIDPSLISKSLAFAATMGGKPIVVFPMYRTIDPEDNVLNPLGPVFRGVSHMFEFRSSHVGPGALFSRELLRTGWNTTYRQLPDCEFWLRNAGLASFHQLPEVLASFRVHAKSQTYASCATRTAEEPIRLIQEVTNAAGLPSGLAFDRLFAAAYVYSACLHARSGRFAVGAQRYAKAWTHSPIGASCFDSIKRIARSIITGVALKTSMRTYK